MVYKIDRSKVVLESFEDETILINMDTGVYFTLNRAGCEVLDLLEAGSDVASIVATLEAKFEAPPGRISASVEMLTRGLVDHGLLTAHPEVAAAPSAAPRTPDDAVRPPFQEPLLELYDDMKELLALDPVHDVDGAGWPSVRATPGGSRGGHGEPDRS